MIDITKAMRGVSPKKPTAFEMTDKDHANVLLLCNLEKLQQEHAELVEALGGLLEVTAALGKIPLPTALTCRLVEQELKATAILEKVK